MKGLEFGWQNYVIVEPAKGQIEGERLRLNAQLREDVSFGRGYTREEAILSLCDSLRRTADQIQAALAAEQRSSGR